MQFPFYDFRLSWECMDQYLGLGAKGNYESDFRLSPRSSSCQSLHLHSCCLRNDYYLFFTLRIYLFAGKPSFTKKQADLFFPPDFADDFPVAMQVVRFNICNLFY